VDDEVIVLNSHKFESDLSLLSFVPSQQMVEMLILFTCVTAVTMHLEEFDWCLGDFSLLY
jgi:hypothetical protein